MAKKAKYSFNGKVWKYSGPSAWYFITIPKNISNQIRKDHGKSEEGWGRLKAKLSIGKTIWDSAIWFDTKHEAYIAPIKAKIRKVEGIADGSTIELKIQVEWEHDF